MEAAPLAVASSGGNNSSGGTAAAGDFFDNTLSQVMNVEQVHYGVVVLKTGSIKDYTFELSGKAIVPEAVNDQGTIVKFEMNPNEKAVLKAVSTADGKTQTVALGKGTEDFTKILSQQAPHKVLASGPITYFDYHLSNYDKDGKVRKNPTKSTFDTVSEGGEEIDQSIPALHSQKALLGQGPVVTFDGTPEEAKRWQNNIYAVLKDYGTDELSSQVRHFV